MIMTTDECKRKGLIVFIVMILITMSVANAGEFPLLTQMQIKNTCDVIYADKLASCIPFRCSKPGIMAMTVPSKNDLQKMSPNQRQQLKKQMASAETRLKKMSPEKRAQLKDRTTSHFEIKGFDTQGRCQTSTMATPKYRQDCRLDKTMLRRVADYVRVASKANDIEIKSTSRLVNGKMVTEQTDIIDGKAMVNPWQSALRNGQCKVLEKVSTGWKSVADGTLRSKTVNKTQSVQIVKNLGQSSNTLFILDASGSMWGQIKGNPKIKIAKQVMAKLVPEIPDTTRIGLIAYGHRRKGDCSDVETLVTLAANDKQSVLKAVKGLNAKGKTPLTRSVNQAIEMLKSEKNPSTVVLVSDGIESCGGDPCATVKTAKAAGVNFILHTVGFGLSKKESVQLQCMAKAGGGQYFQANNAKELLKSTRKAVQPVGVLKLTATVNGKVTRLSYRVEDAKTGKIVQQPALPTSSGFPIQLTAGHYNVFVLPAGVGGTSEQKFALNLKAGEVIKKVLSFGKGVLHLTVTVNGKPAHALIHIVDSITKKGVYESSVFGFDTPLDINLAAGKVDIVVQAGGRDIPEKRIEGVDILAGKTTNQIIPVKVKSHSSSVIDDNGMEQNTDRPGGGDFKHIVFTTDDPALCKTACDTNARCKAWTYVKPHTVQGDKPNCWLKRSAPPASRSPCCVSGLKSPTK